MLVVLHEPAREGQLGVNELAGVLFGGEHTERVEKGTESNALLTRGFLGSKPAFLLHGVQRLAQRRQAGA